MPTATTAVDAVPCTSCGRTDGAVQKGYSRPMRIDGARVGINGRLCKRCYSRILRRITPAPVRAVAPCEVCGDPGGATHAPGQKYPARYAIEHKGRTVMGCRSCWMVTFVAARKVTEHPSSVAARVSSNGFQERAKTVLVEAFAAMGAGLTVVEVMGADGVTWLGVKRFTLGDLTPACLSALIRHGGGETFRAVYRDGLAPAGEKSWSYPAFQRRAHRASARGRRTSGDHE